MTSIHLTSANEIRRVVIAAVVIVTLGAAGAVVGLAASNDEVKPTVTATSDNAVVQLAAAKIAPEVADAVVSQEKLVEVVIATPPALPTIKTIEMEVTAYCPCTKCCGPKAQGITASGKRIDYNDGQFVA